MNTPEQTRQRLVDHYQKYPLLQIQDLFKFLHQSSFGCEHAVPSAAAACTGVKEEYALLSHNTIPVIEPLDGAYSRVPLSYLNGGLRAETLGRLFFLSAKEEATGKANLRQKLNIAGALIADGALPFSVTAFEEAVARWETADFSALHHSDTFRRAYAPSYRVIDNRFLPFLPLLTRLDTQLAEGSVTLAIEGGSAAGKSTLSEWLCALYNCAVIHMDDFFLRTEQRTAARLAEIGGNIDYERFATEIVQPMQQGLPLCYRPFDCGTMGFKEPLCITPTPLTVVEGVYSMHPSFGKYYTLSVFLSISSVQQKERIAKRNTPLLAKRFWEEWIPMETAYFVATDLPQRCDIQIEVE